MVMAKYKHMHMNGNCCGLLNYGHVTWQQTVVAFIDIICRWWCWIADCNQAAGTFDLLVNIVIQSLSKDSHRKVLSKLLELSYNVGDSLVCKHLCRTGGRWERVKKETDNKSVTQTEILTNIIWGPDVVFSLSVFVFFFLTLPGCSWWRSIPESPFCYSLNQPNIRVKLTSSGGVNWKSEREEEKKGRKTCHTYYISAWSPRSLFSSFSHVPVGGHAWV